MLRFVLIIITVFSFLFCNAQKQQIGAEHRNGSIYAYGVGANKEQAEENVLAELFNVLAINISDSTKSISELRDKKTTYYLYKEVRKYFRKSNLTFEEKKCIYKKDKWYCSIVLDKITQKKQWENDWIKTNSLVISFYNSGVSIKENEKIKARKYFNNCLKHIDERNYLETLLIGLKVAECETIQKLKGDRNYIAEIEVYEQMESLSTSIDTLTDLYYSILFKCNDSILKDCGITFHKPKLIKNNSEGNTNISATIRDGLEVYSIKDIFNWKVNKYIEKDIREQDRKKFDDKELSADETLEIFKKYRYFFHSKYIVDTNSNTIVFHYSIKDLLAKVSKDTIIFESSESFSINVFEKSMQRRSDFTEFISQSQKRKESIIVQPKYNQSSIEETLYNVLNSPKNVSEALKSLSIKNELSSNTTIKTTTPIYKNNFSPTEILIIKDSTELNNEIVNTDFFKLDPNSNDTLRFVYAKDNNNKPYRVLGLLENGKTVGEPSGRKYLTATDFIGDIAPDKLPKKKIKIPRDEDKKEYNAPNPYHVIIDSFYYSKKITIEQYCTFLNISHVSVSKNGFCNGKPYIFINYNKCPIYYKDNEFKHRPETNDKEPVNYVSWYGAKAFCDWYSENCRLPSEAEYRCLINKTNENDSLKEWCEDDYFNVWQINKDVDQKEGSNKKFNFSWYKDEVTQLNYYLRLIRKRNPKNENLSEPFNNVLFKHKDDSLIYIDNYSVYKITKEPRDDTVEKGAEQKVNKIYIYYPYIMRSDIGFRIIKKEKKLSTH
ncbi:MAG: SUMF1/EgtB/PvdO family nonheme iron enzyme [Bacteroidales bacterium]|nr:SUMF1/EgtB/PvdO family nonheme iron enzyme [Bacteroidales bacterium]